MTDYTFQAWANPTQGLPDVADHTFVYCTDNQRYFYCWGGGDIHHEKSVLILTGKWRRAYPVANCYRTPFTFNGRTYPDTAAVGVYGLNGVCHQSANLFMYASTYSAMTWANRRENSGQWGMRPMGLPVSYAAYGPTGAPSPGTPPAAHWAVWWATTFRPCASRHGKLASEGDSLDGVQPMRIAGAPEEIRTHEDSRRFMVAQFAAYAREAQPVSLGTAGVGAEAFVEPEVFADLHLDFLREKDRLIEAEYKDDAQFIGEPLADRINQLTVDFQKDLEQKLGPQGYTTITGLEPGQQVRLVDPRIASGKS